MTSSLDHAPSAIPAAGRDLSAARRRGSVRRFAPPGTVFCDGRPAFRSQLARDLGLLLDLDRSVVAWACLPAVLEMHDVQGEVVERVPDFAIRRIDGTESFLDAGETGLRPVERGVRYKIVPEAEIRHEPALSNARDMMRYARRTVPLGDRVRLLAHLEETSPITLAEAASGMRESAEPVGAVVALALKRFVHLDWRDAPIGPETPVRPRP